MSQKLAQTLHLAQQDPPGEINLESWFAAPKSYGRNIGAVTLIKGLEGPAATGPEKSAKTV